MQDSAKPVTSISFPAVTICSEGFDLDAVTKVIAEEFKAWKEKRNISSSSLEEDKKLLDRFVEEEYAIGKGENIFDFVRAMNSPSPDMSMAQSSVLGSMAACARQKDNGKQRKKRETDSPVHLIYQEAGFAYHKVEVSAGLPMTHDTITCTCESQGMRPVCLGGLESVGENQQCQRSTFLPNTVMFLKDKIKNSRNVFYWHHGGQAMDVESSKRGGDNIISGNPTLYSLCVAPTGKNNNRLGPAFNPTDWHGGSPHANRWDWGLR